MRAIYLAAAALTAILPWAPLQAQLPSGNLTTRETVAIPDGMEEYAIGDLKLVVPKGIRITRQGGNHLILENTDEYAARQLSGMQKQLEKTQEELLLLRKRVEELESALGTKK
jgi:hypothetical protein